MPPPALPSAHRPKSALAKSSASSLDENIAQSSARPVSPSRQHSKKTFAPHDAGTSIQVVVRCRRRAEREIHDSSPVIVTTNGARGENITIEAGSTTSTFGVVTLAPTRTYPFDRVFGPEADQAMIYNDVVSPFLEQALAGYNCTLFAYGQTGTGKTYTMQGDVMPTPLGNPSINAGIIPRVLYKLFQHLEANVPDFSVKISFVELYNEELRDLLASELTSPIGNSQPMGVGGGQHTQGQGNSGLKIFDDSTKRGVFIQGLEEIPVKDAAHAIALLTKGSMRRQVAATNFNDHSSRSHSVFSITMHLKETSALGDDLLKVAKLNLVDLAGSENIGRSGAENKRAREAGMINQSLLTLGRVINGLVDKSSHVPYRESKLTRLLQDSLGGRTKTCIIATVSPAKCNMEETLSTLEYALRAKSIRNKPEVNQRLTKNALMKEYVAEIERLKGDLTNAREKNGIVIQQEAWDQQLKEQEEVQTKLDETKRQVTWIESQLCAVREEFDQSVTLLQKRELELINTKEALKITAESLETTRNELRGVRGDFEKECIVREAHEQTEVRLNLVAEELKGTLEKSLADAQSLFEKLGRKSLMANANIQAVSKYGKSLLENTVSTNRQLQDFMNACNQSNVKLCDGAQQLRSAKTKALESQTAAIDSQLQFLSDHLSKIQSSECVSDTALCDMETSIKSARTAMQTCFGQWANGLLTSFEMACFEVQDSGLKNAEVVGKAITAMSVLLSSVISETKNYIDLEHDASAEARRFVTDNASKEIERLCQQNLMLTGLLRVEKVESERSRDELLHHISGLLAEYIDGRDKRLRDAIDPIRETVVKGEVAMERLTARQVEQFEVGVKRRADWDATLQKHDVNTQKLHGDGLKGLSRLTGGFQTGLTTIKTHINQSISAQSKQMAQQNHAMTVNCEQAFDHLRQAKRARIDATDNLVSQTEQAYHSMKQGLGVLSTDINQHVEMLVDEIDELQTMVHEYHATTTTNLSTIQQATQRVLQEGTMEDASTGSTPTKRNWTYSTHWPLTRPREDILRDWKEEAIQVSPPNVPNTSQKKSGPYLAIADNQSLESSPVDADIGMSEEESPELSASSDASTSVSNHTPPSKHIISTTSKDIGKDFKIPGFGQPNKPLKDRPTNIPPRSRRIR
ncbi:kinesin-domain-containing protein [Hysterangium stoloniferum]|nr:kinesin-domain-containing protein [Hysterangium stoloniferum]